MTCAEGCRQRPCQEKSFAETTVFLPAIPALLRWGGGAAAANLSFPLFLINVDKLLTTEHHQKLEQSCKADTCKIYIYSYPLQWLAMEDCVANHFEFLVTLLEQQLIVPRSSTVFPTVSGIAIK